MNKKVFWTSIGLIFVIITLAIGAIVMFNVASWFAILCAASITIVVFIADGCKKHLWFIDWEEQSKEKETKDSNENEY